MTTTSRIGPWAAIGLMVAAFIVLEIVLPFGARGRHTAFRKHARARRSRFGP